MHPCRTPSVVLNQFPLLSFNKTLLSFSLLYRVFIFDSTRTMKTEAPPPNQNLRGSQYILYLFLVFCTLLLFNIDLLKIQMVRLT